jgi:hypothetical protein
MRRVFVLLGVGCGDGDPGRFVFDDMGWACVFAAAADEPVTVSVTPEPCKSCYGSRYEGSCTVILDGGRLDVTSEASYLFEHTDEDCGNACAEWVVQCVTADPVPAGTYELSFHGATSPPLTVPHELGTSVCTP